MLRILDTFVPATFSGTRKRTPKKTRRRLQYEALEARTMFASSLGKGQTSEDAFSTAPPPPPSTMMVAPAAATSASLYSSTVVNTYDIDRAIEAGLIHLQNVLDLGNGGLPFFAVWALTKDQAKSYGDKASHRDAGAHMAFDRHLVSNVAGRALYSLMLGSDTLDAPVNQNVLDVLESTVLKSLHKPRNGKWKDTSPDNQMVTGLASDPRKYHSQQFDLTFLFNMGAGMRGALGLATLSDDPNAILNGYNWSAQDVFETAVHNIRQYYVYGNGPIGGPRAYNWEVFRSALGLQGGDRIAGSVSKDKVKNWSNLWQGWVDPFLVYDLVKYYEATGHQGSLELAKELRDYVFDHRFPSDPYAAPFHTFTHMFEVVGEMNAYSRLALVTGDADMMNRIRMRYEGLRGIGFNTIGWVPEYLGRGNDVGEINNTGELIETALNFAEWGWTEYYDDVERFTRGHLLPSQLLDTSFVINNTKPKNDGQRDIAARVYGAFGFPAPYGHVSTLRPSSTGAYHVDITSGAVASLSEIKKATYRYDNGTHRINLLFDVDNDRIKVVSPYPNGDRLTITTKVAGDVRLRLPSWADRAAVEASLAQQGLQYGFLNDSVVIYQSTAGATFHVAMPLKTQWATDIVNGRPITVVWHGDSIIGMSGMGTPMPFFAEAAMIPLSLASPPPPPSNTAPVVQAGVDQSAWSGTFVALDGTVSDDQLPTNPHAVSFSWSKVSGPGNVEFGDPSQVDTSVKFDAAGQYVLRLTASDGQLSTTDDVTINVSSANAAVTISFQDGASPHISYSGTRDSQIHDPSAANGQTPAITGNAPTLEIVGVPDIAALLGWDIDEIPTGSHVLAAAIQFEVLNPTAHDYEIYALSRAWDELAASWDAASVSGNWAAGGANGQGDHGITSLAQFAPRTNGVYTMPLNSAGLALLQQWINDPQSNHGLIFKDFTDASDNAIISSSEAADALMRPKLIVTYETPPDPVPGDETPPAPVNQAPLVNAGADQTIQLPMTATLNATVSDDGLPATSGPVALAWTKVSGPGNATFSSGTGLSTTAQFSAAGTYVLRLTANDGTLQSYDEVTVTVIPPLVHHTPPTVNVGPDQTVTLPNGAALSGIITLGAYPAPTLDYTWTLTTGPAAVTYTNTKSPNSFVHFTTPGTYVLRLTAYDGHTHAYDELVIHVQAAAPPPSAPSSRTKTGARRR